MNRFEFIKTNWINLLGVLFVLYLYCAILGVSQNYIFGNETLASALAVGFVGGIITVLFYWAVAWIPLLILLLSLEFILLHYEKNSLSSLLIKECIIFASIFLFLAIRFSEPVWLIALVTFLVTQRLRRHIIGGPYKSFEIE